MTPNPETEVAEIAERFNNKFDCQFDDFQMQAFVALLHSFAQSVKEGERERWNTVTDGKPEYDGSYLCFIRQKQECDNVWEYCKVVELINNNWQLADREEVTHWRILPLQPPFQQNEGPK